MLFSIVQSLLHLDQDFIKLPSLAMHPTAVHTFAAEIPDSVICHRQHPAQITTGSVGHALGSNLPAEFQRSRHEILQRFIHASIV